MTSKFKLGDRVTSTLYPENGEGSVVRIVSEVTIGVRFEDYGDYQDEDPDGEDDDWEDLHYVNINHARLVEEIYQYDPTQAGDLDDDI